MKKNKQRSDAIVVPSTWQQKVVLLYLAPRRNEKVGSDSMIFRHIHRAAAAAER
jgi:hypothetical protein